jgi:hypothetical protein
MRSSIKTWLLLLTTGLVAGIGAGCDSAQEVDGNFKLDSILSALEKGATEGYRAGLLDFGAVGDSSAARGCVDITYPNGGTTRVCGPNTDTIIANCARRGWDCKKTSGAVEAALLDLALDPEPEGTTCFVNSTRDTISILDGASVAELDDIVCSFASQAGEDHCAQITSDCACAGCTTSDGGNGVGVVTCPDCPNIGHCLDD